MTQPKKKSSLEQVLKLVEQLSPEDVLELQHQLSSKNLAWSNTNLEDPSERAALLEQEEARAGERVRQAFQNLQDQGVMDKNGYLITRRLPPDMERGSECDV
jgi:hypothetical protein